MTDAFTCDDELHRLDRRIVQAATALADARDACNRSPNAETCAIEDMAENTVNSLLERRYELVEAERIVRA